jgi:TRAP-type mannitol/chloroaromatic compound transport system permease small subunit
MSLWTGKVVQWLCVILILVLSYEVTMRYVFNAPTVWVMQTSMMIGGAIITLGWCFVQQQKSHVRVDLFYGRLSSKRQALVNVLGSLVFFFPFVGILTYRSFTQFLYSVAMNEKMPETAWYPPVYPIKLVIFVGFLLFLLQGGAQFVRDLQALRKGQPDA